MCIHSVTTNREYTWFQLTTVQLERQIQANLSPLIFSNYLRDLRRTITDNYCDSQRRKWHREVSTGYLQPSVVTFQEIKMIFYNTEILVTMVVDIVLCCVYLWLGRRALGTTREAPARAWNTQVVLGRWMTAWKQHKYL